ncbi:hypothetical protein C8F04DRAFT_956722 [Mycena alexandri]|uniref:Uncharacterized protein n=1 Tax=Mycena alexandri TaxID=1745969 RepID=A0AAD6SVL5_9AGAR|nr:hypothetical protein C8F04DRAFT_956722 [Mycena alexandri]
MEGLAYREERHVEAVTDEEVRRAVWAGDDWKAPDSVGLQMGFVRRGWPVLAPVVCAIFKSSANLGLYPTSLKASNAIPTHKPAKKDKSSPKAWRPVEQHAAVLAKPLERLMADRVTFQVESRGVFDRDQYGGRSSHSTLQAVKRCTRVQP